MGDEASVLVAEALGARASDVVADLCAGPGGKTVRLAGTGARVVAVDIHLHRSRLIGSTVNRLGLGSRVAVVRADGLHPPVSHADRVLVDAPCSGLGVLRRRAEARWRVTRSDVENAAGLQSGLLEAGFKLLRPGGTLVYAVCTVSRAETTGVLDRFLAAEPAAAAVDVLPDIPRPAGLGAGPGLQLLPHIHGTDGMFVARLERVG